MASWRAVMPDYEIREWTEKNSPMDLPYMKAACAQKRWSKAANYVRLLALQREGGIYFDTDIEVLKRFDPLLVERCFLGFQGQRDHAHWVNNAVLGAEAGHPFLAACMEMTLNLFEQEGALCASPVVTTRVLRDWGLVQYGRQTLRDVTLFPVEYFYPHRWTDTLTSDCLTSETYCIHHWARWRRQRWQRFRRQVRTKWQGLLRAAAAVRDAARRGGRG